MGGAGAEYPQAKNQRRKEVVGSRKDDRRKRIEEENSKYAGRRMREGGPARGSQVRGTARGCPAYDQNQKGNRERRGEG